MPTTDIPKTEWSLFFDSFSLRHEGWIVDLNVDGQDDIAGKTATNGSKGKIEANDLPLEGISADEKDGENIISISVGKEGSVRLRHEIKEPKSVRLEATDDGADKAIEITAQSEKAYLLLRSPMHTDTVDGYVQ
jgi:hypothetical protein